MSLGISQKIPSFNTSKITNPLKGSINSTPDKTLVKLNKIVNGNSKIDIDSSIRYYKPTISTKDCMPNISGMFNSKDLPSFTMLDLPNMDIPKWKLPDMNLPAFSKLDMNIGKFNLPDIHSPINTDWFKGKFNGLKLKGLDTNFKCSIKADLNPKNKSLKYKHDFGKLNNINCLDATAGLNSPHIGTKAVKALMDTTLCSKSPKEATSSSLKDMDTIASDTNELSSNTNSLLTGISSSLVGGKFNVASAKGLLTNKKVKQSLKNTIKSSNKSAGDIFKIAKEDSKTTDKNSTLKLASELSGSDANLVSRTHTTNIAKYAKQASKESQLGISGLTGNVVNKGQKISMLDKVIKMGKAKNPLSNLIAA